MSKPKGTKNYTQRDLKAIAWMWFKAKNSKEEIAQCLGRSPKGIGNIIRYRIEEVSPPKAEPAMVRNWRETEAEPEETAEPVDDRHAEALRKDWQRAALRAGIRHCDEDVLNRFLGYVEWVSETLGVDLRGVTISDFIEQRRQLAEDGIG